MTDPILGYDVSVAQGNLSLAHWREIARTRRFVSIKCGNGNNGVDAHFAANVAGARQAELALQVYHVGFALPNDPAHPGRSPVDQARAHHAAANGVGAAPRDLAPCLDLEQPAPEDWTRWGVDGAFVLRWAVEYLDEMDRLCGRTPYVYVYPWFDKLMIAGADLRMLARLARFPLWAAEYEIDKPYLIPPWTRVALWQRSGGGATLPNGAKVDEDVFEGDDSEFQAALTVTTPIKNPLAGEPVPGLVIPGANEPTDAEG